MNVRLALRSLAKTPGFTAAVVLTLALGIGANSGVFSAIDAVLLRPLPFPEGDRLMLLGQKRPQTSQTFVAPVRLMDWGRLNSTFQAMSGYYTEDASEISGELPEKVKRAFIAPRFFEVLGVSPALGRAFQPEEEHFGGRNAVLIGDRFWQKHFNADAGVLGKRLRFGQGSFEIIGVMPVSFRFPDPDVDLWFTSPMDGPFAQARQLTWFSVIGRLKPGVTISQARENMSAVQADLGRQFPQTDKELSVDIQPLKEVTVGGIRASLWVVFGSVSLLLLIACTNIAALLLARATQRQQEISVRYSLGASRASVVAQLLTETFVLALGGALLGLCIAAGSSGVFRALAESLPRLEEIGLDWRIVLYTLVSAAAVTFLCGLIPAIQATRRSLTSSLAHSGRALVSSRNPVQWLLVGLQVALAVTLLSGAGLLLRSFRELGRVSPGFEASHVLTLHISTTWAETGPASKVWTDRTLEFLSAVPGVESAATSEGLPGVPLGFQGELQVAEGRAETDPKILSDIRFVSNGYFATMQIPLLTGELCRDAGPRQMLVNRSFANTYFGGSNAIGKHLLPPGPAAQPVEIRGIVGDARELGLNKAPAPVVYACGSSSQPGTSFLLRTHGDPAAMAETIRRKIHEIEPARAVFDVTPLEDHLSEAFAENRLRTVLLAFFAITAVSLACVGLYGTLSYIVHTRRREVGLRLALGALRGQIVRKFLGQGLSVAALAALAGLALSLAFTRLLAGMLYGVAPTDPFTLTAVILLTLAVAAVASLIPAIRAALLEPMQVLRDE
ncbi:MAG TPA: ABC transporter permease [Bryobacteraceae bacterium]|jgi:putative ABC transport system permease protein|nr:ABC transporter permease [Bryobacteraceae bacterium]